MCVSCKIDNIAELGKFSDDVDRKIEFGSFDGREDGEYSGVGFV